MRFFGLIASSGEAEDYMQAAAEALEKGPQPGEEVLSFLSETADPIYQDPFFRENMLALHQGWAIDAERVTPAGGLRGWLGRLLHRPVSRVLSPQWEQAGAFHGAVVRVLDSMLHRLLGRMAELDARLASPEQVALARRVEQLESELADLRHRMGGEE